MEGRARWGIAALAALLSLGGAAGCQGPAGPRGFAGQEGQDGAPGLTGEDGERGQDGERGERGAPGVPGEDGRDGGAEVLEVLAEGLVGIVTDTTGAAVEGGRVVLIPAADVEAMAREPLVVGLSPEDVAALPFDEPLEDLLDAPRAQYPEAAVGSGGVFRLESLPGAAFFVVWAPGEGDPSHLPGGSACRIALEPASVRGGRLDIRVSTRPSTQATFVGSTPCLGCHGRHRSFGSAHRVGLRALGGSGPYQDTRPWAEFREGEVAFEAGQRLYFWGCDPDRAGEARCRVSQTEPSEIDPDAVTLFEVALGRDPQKRVDEAGAWFVEVINRAGPGVARYDVALAYGGAIHRQVYLTRSGGKGAQMLMFQRNFDGDARNESPSDWPFVDYRSDRWYDFERLALKEPDVSGSFDRQCAGCHFTGFRLEGDDERGWSASAVSDPNGAFDYDGDGRREEINVGCEACHGPGSEHLEARARGAAIVSPGLLTPEREVMLCGACHSRPLGIGGMEAPLDAEGRMPPAWLRRADFAASFASRVEGGPEDFYESGDARSSRQQATDLLRSTKYRNGAILMTCSGCHDPHGDARNPSDLRAPPGDNVACTGCHGSRPYVEVYEHVAQATAQDHGAVPEGMLQCRTCHMTRTAFGGAGLSSLLDNSPREAPPVQYVRGDLSSHRFTVTGAEAAAHQPVAFTDECAFCHVVFLPNP